MIDPAHEAALHSARLRVELAQSKTEQRDYLKNVELARVLDKRAERKGGPLETTRKRLADEQGDSRKKKKPKAVPDDSTTALDSVLSSVF